MYIERVSGEEVEVVGYLEYLNDFEKKAGNEVIVKNDAYIELVDAVEGCIKYNADGMTIPFVDKEFSFSRIEGDGKNIFEYEGMRDLREW